MDPSSKENRVNLTSYTDSSYPSCGCPSGEVLQDSTLIIERLEQEFPSPSIVPMIQIKLLISPLEEFGDEWVNKIMFHYRWW